MAKSLGKRQIFYLWLAGIYLPGMQVEDCRTPLRVHFLHAILRVCIRKQAKVSPARERKTLSKDLQTTHREFVQTRGDLVRTQRSLHHPVVWVKPDRKDRRIILKLIFLQDR